MKTLATCTASLLLGLLILTNIGYAAVVKAPANIIEFLPVKLTNYQSAGLASGAQIMVNLPSSFGVNEISNAINGEWFFSNGTIINSWLEGNVSNDLVTRGLSSNTLTYWLEYSWPNSFLSGNTGSSPINTIYFGITGNVITPANTLLNGVKTGEAPQLSCISSPDTSIPICNAGYGAKDNGKTIFTFYDNFAHNDVGTVWNSTDIGSVNYTISNGLSVSRGGGSIPTINAIVYNTNSIDALLTFGHSPSTWSKLGAVGAYVINNQGIFYGQTVLGLCGRFYQLGTCDSSQFSRYITTQAENDYNVWSTSLSIKNETFSFNYTDSVAITQSGIPNSTNLLLTAGEYDSNPANVAPSYNVIWIRERTNPPNDVMPSVSFSSVAYVKNGTTSTTSSSTSTSTTTSINPDNPLAISVPSQYANNDIKILQNQTLSSNLYGRNCTVAFGVTLTTEGYSILCTKELVNLGNIDAGSFSSGGGDATCHYGGECGGNASYGVFIEAGNIIAGNINLAGHASVGGANVTPNGGGGGGGGSGALLLYYVNSYTPGSYNLSGGIGQINYTYPDGQLSGGNGGNTRAPGGIGGANNTVNGTNGATPAYPTPITYNDIVLWYNAGVQKYLSGGGGGEGAYACGINPAFEGSGVNGTSNSLSFGGSGGGGGGSDDVKGDNVCGQGGNGGSGLVLTYQFKTPQNNQTIQQMITVLENSGFTNVTNNQNIALTTNPAVMFSAYDKNANGTNVGNTVLVFAFPLGYQFKNWNTSSPTTFAYLNLSGNRKIGTITFGSAVANSFFAGKSSGSGTGFINWKELVPFGTVPPKTIITTSTSTTSSTTSSASSSSSTSSTTTLASTTTIISPWILFPSHVYQSNSSSSFLVNVQGGGFHPNSAIAFGYGSSKGSTTMIMIDAKTNSNGNWNGSFDAPWGTGSYLMYAQDAQGALANANLIVTNRAPAIVLPNHVVASNSSKESIVNVSGFGFVAGSHIQFGYSPIPPYSHVMIDAIANSNGNWNASFGAPWSNGNYLMTAISSGGSANATLVVATTTTVVTSVSTTTV